MYFNHIKYFLIDLKLFKIDLLLNQTAKHLIICVGSILGYENGLLCKVGLSLKIGYFMLSYTVK